MQCDENPENALAHGALWVLLAQSSTASGAEAHFIALLLRRPD